MNVHGYVPAAAQVALLQTYGGMAVASAVQTLAEDMQRDAACPRSRRSRRGRRSRRTRDDPRPRPGATDLASDDEHHSVPVCPDSAAAAGADTWRALDDVDLAAEMRHPVPTLQDVPSFMRAAVREALVQALRRLKRALAEPGSAESVDAARAWKLFLLAPRMLLTRTDQHGSQGRAELLGRASAFHKPHAMLAAQPRMRRPQNLLRSRKKEAAPSMLQSETMRAVTSAPGLDYLRPRPGNRGDLGHIDRPSTPSPGTAHHDRPGRVTPPA